MAAEDRSATPGLDVLRWIAEDPGRCTLYAALRRIDAARPDRPRLGDARRPSEEWLRLGQEPTLAFAAAELAGVAADKASGRQRLLQFGFGLFGPNGPLPIHLTEYARDRLKNSNDPTMVRFADVFHHRMLALFYRAWANAQPAVSFDRPDDDSYRKYFGAFVGVAQPESQDADDWPDSAKSYYCGRIGNQARGPEGLTEVLEDYFGVPVRLREFVGSWLSLDESDTARLGVRNSELGVSAVAGALVWDCAQKLRLVLGPMDLENLRRFLPGTGTLEALASTVRMYLGDQFAWDLNLILECESVPPIVLGERGRLGWTTWLTPRPSPGDADEPVLDVMSSLFGALAGVVRSQAVTRSHES